MKLTKFLLPLITLIVIITSCGKDDLPTVDNGLTAKPSMLAHNGTDADKLPMPTGVTATAKVNTNLTTTEKPVYKVEVSWNAVTLAKGYKVVAESVEKDLAGNAIREFKQDDVTSLSTTFPDIPVGNYTVKVRAIATSHPSHNSHFSDEKTFTVNTTTTGGTTITPLATPSVSASGVLYNSGKGKTTITWDPIPHAASYSVKVNGSSISANTSPISLSNLAPGPLVVTVIAKAGDVSHSDSQPGTTTINVNNPRPISTPVISGTVSYTAASAGTVTVDPKFIWPPNNKLTAVTFKGSGLSTGTGSYSATHNRDDNATDYDYDASLLTQSNLPPGSYKVTVKAIAGGTYDDDNWVNSAVGSKTFTVAVGSLKAELIDEYGFYTNLNITLTPSFSLTYQLMASRLGTDKTGRDYKFTITATNGEGTAVTGVSAVSNVPHDQR